MKCTNCNHELAANANFCSYCGAKAVREEPKPSDVMICPTCGKVFGEEMMYCDVCGAKLRKGYSSERTKLMGDLIHNISALANQTETTTSQADSSNTSTISPKTTITEKTPVNSPKQALYTSKMMNLYEGDMGFKATKASGYVKAYSDHIEFEVKLGSSAGAIVGIVGMLAAKKKAEDYNMHISYSDITGAYEKNYMGIKCVTIDLSDGRQYTFSPYLPISSHTDELMSQLKKQMIR